jgi:hypothetical protein
VASHCLRVFSPFLALESHGEKSTFCTVSVGSVISTEVDLAQPGLVPISLRGQSLLAFARDLTEHTEPIDLSLHHSQIHRHP